MSNDTKANYARIGFTIVAGAVAIIAALVYFGGVGNRHERLIAETYCREVSGLSRGGEVNFRGVKVGEVAEITFVGKEYDGVSESDAQQILIRMALNSKMLTPPDGTPPEEVLRRFVDHGLRATVASSGITGISHIELNYPKTPQPDPEMTWRSLYVCIPPAPSIMQSFSDSAAHILTELDAMDFKGAWSNVTDLVSSMSQLAQSANAIVDSQKAAIGGVMNQIEDVGARIRELVTTLQENPSLFLRDRTPDPIPETR